MSNGGHDARTHDARTLDRSSCMSLLSTVTLGRVGLSVDALPVIMPVGFHIDGDRIVFSLHSADMATGTVNGAVVAFEADDVDPATGVGWSVLVQGPARLLPHSLEDRSQEHPLWESQEHPRWEFVSVSTEVITGWLAGTEMHSEPLSAT